MEHYTRFLPPGGDDTILEREKTQCLKYVRSSLVIWVRVQNVDIMCESIPTARSPPRANPGYLFYDKSRGRTFDS